MATGLISKKYLIDIANAIRVKLDSENTYTPAQMATAIANIDGTITGTITKSENADAGIITDTLLEDICDAIRAKNDDSLTTYTPAQMADAILAISSGGGGSVDLVSWSSGTDEQIAAMLDAANAGTIDLQQDGNWAVGDVRQISVASFDDGTGAPRSSVTADIAITSFDDYESCGCLLQFDFKTLLATVGMNATATSSGGWGSSRMKTTTMPALVNALPTWLKNRLVEFSCRTGLGQNTSASLVSGNKLALRSKIEITGNSQNVASGEGTQLDYYKTQSNRQKGKYYWTRSPYSLNNDSFATIADGGYAGWAYAGKDYRIAPFGCLGGI